MTPITVKAKIIMPKLRLRSLKIGWDNIAPEDTGCEWETLVRSLVVTEQIRFTRSLTPEHPEGKPTLV